MTELFDRLHELPDGFFEVELANIRSVFPRPTLVHLEGENPHTLFVKILLHGNEHTGLTVMQRLLRKFEGKLPRSLMMFVGNVRAAEANRRYLPDQEDYNRCWPGTHHEPSETTKMMHRVFDIACGMEPFAAVDVHNNTGRNPHYACITDVNMQNRNLAAHFNKVAMVMTRKGVSTMAFDGICPAVTLECGMPGDPDGIDEACRFLEDLLYMEEISDKEPTREELHLVITHAMLKIPEDVSFAFDKDAGTDLSFEPDFEDRNFTLFDPHQVFGYTRIARPLSITDEEGLDITDATVRIDDGRIYLNYTVMPAMITRNKEVVRQDCLCYLLQDYLG